MTDDAVEESATTTRWAAHSQMKRVSTCQQQRHLG